jgi:hypothetical protein
MNESVAMMEWWLEENEVRVLGKKAVSLSLCPPQIKHGLCQYGDIRGEKLAAVRPS